MKKRKNSSINCFEKGITVLSCLSGWGNRVKGETAPHIHNLRFIPSPASQQSRVSLSQAKKSVETLRNSISSPSLNQNCHFMANSRSSIPLVCMYRKEQIQIVD
ncbi:hypothetical protein RJT34_25121 [Clitoria ternatea]|uniref:Uncharacterized protein n=1 Tax=Clitoria ternatea TaxID=43366 RepID=A0AAN9IIM1_CLITE